jgi:hypothetical protein
LILNTFVSKGQFKEEIMKRLLNTMFALIFAVSVVGIVGCDDEKKDDNNTVQDIQTAGDVAETPEDVVAPEDVMETPEDVTETPEDVVAPEDVVEPAGACMNETDGPLLDTPEKRDAVTAQATDCGIGCLGDDDVATCSVTCLVGATGLSVECSACYAGMVGCSKDNCLAECLAEPGSEACSNCQTEAGCFDDFYACSGMTPAAE